MNIDFESNKISYEKYGIVLTNSDVEILKKNDIDYNKYKSIDELLYDLENFTESNDEIEEVLINLEERNYYINVNK